MREPKFLLALLPPSFWGRRAEGPQSQIESRGSVDWGLLRIWTCGAGSEAGSEAGRKEPLRRYIVGVRLLLPRQIASMPQSAVAKIHGGAAARPRARGTTGGSRLIGRRLGGPQITSKCGRHDRPTATTAAPLRADPIPGDSCATVAKSRPSPSFACSSFPSTVSARTLNLSRGSVRSSEWVDRGRHHRFLNARNGMEAPRTADGTADADEDHADGIDVLEVTDDARTFLFVNL